MPAVAGGVAGLSRARPPPICVSAEVDPSCACFLVGLFAVLLLSFESSLRPVESVFVRHVVYTRFLPFHSVVCLSSLLAGGFIEEALSVDEAHFVGCPFSGPCFWRQVGELLTQPSAFF